MNVLSIQSSVAYGHVGNSAATLPLQRLGIGVWPVNTTHLSNHLGHPSWRGGAAQTGMVADIVAGIEELGVLGQCDALLSGFLGAAALGAAVLDALEMLRADADRKIRAVVLDLAMPDLGGREAVIEIRRLRPGLPVIVATGFGENARVERFGTEKINAFLLKPYEPEDLIDAVRAALSEVEKTV